MSYEEEDTCMSYEEEDTCVSYEEEDTCVSYEEEDTCVSYEEEDTCNLCRRRARARQYIVTKYGKYARALTFENLRRRMHMRRRIHVLGH